MEEESESDCEGYQRLCTIELRVLYPSKRLFFIKYRSMAVMSNLIYDLLCGRLNFDDLDCFFEVYSTNFKSDGDFDLEYHLKKIFNLLNGMDPDTKHPLCCIEKKKMIDYMISHGDMCKGDIIEYKFDDSDNGYGEHLYFMWTGEAFEEM
jgi:hypothetical protein